MERKLMVKLMLLFILCSTWCFGDRQLERPEILQLLEQLTSQPRDTWIPSGTMEAVHEEYRAAKVSDEVQIKEMVLKNVAQYQANVDKPERTEYLQKLQLDAIPFNTQYELANEYTMISAESIKFDGQRFLWEISVESRVDSVKPGRDLEGNYMTNEFNVELNGHRVFAWDGENYIIYSPLAEHAYIDSAGNMPHSVNGPLTAGLIPWGYGYYSLESLSALQSEGLERTVDGQVQIVLTLNNDDGSQMSFVLDPSHEYAVVSCSISGRGSTIISKNYSGYQNISGQWVPTSIVLEKHEIGSQKLLARDIWTIDMVDSGIPNDDDFKVEYKEDTVIEYASPINNQPLTYRHSSIADTDIILGEKLMFDSQEGIAQQNCATAAMKYALSRMGIYVNDSQLASLVGEPDNGTSLYAMKSFAEDLGLGCRAVKTDLETIKGLGNCQIILYLPQKRHFVVLESIDGDYARIVDLASRKFYYRTEASFFDMDWTTGIALLLSNDVIQDNLKDLDEDELTNIVGAAGYSCTRWLQGAYVTFCQLIGDLCTGYFTFYYERWGCEAAESGSGSCSTTWYYRRTRSPCVEDIFDPWRCTVTGNWTHYWMRACM